MSGSRASLGAFLAFLAAMLFVVPSLAAPTIRSSLQPDTIEVGDTTTLSATVTPGEHVTEAQLQNLPSGLSIVGQQISPQFQVSIVNGQMIQSVSARVVFRLRAAREGTYNLGPVVVVSEGAHIRGDRASLRVVAKGTLPPRQQNPFDPFGMFGLGSPFDNMPEPQTLEPQYPIDPRFNLDRPVDSGTFLHATIDKRQAVVGEQVTLSVYVYADVTQGDPDLSDPHEVGTSEFLRQPLLKEDAQVERSGFARVAGRTYAVALLRKYALFPLHTGDLEITPMRLRISRLGERASESLKVRVTEPPMEHRPAGYTIGDVGRFTLSADVAPREVERGAAVAVNVELSGWGNLPTALTVPARPGVTWLDPDVKENLHVLDVATGGGSDVWGGTRRFSYLVTPKKEGDLDLGEITVPFYDPRTHTYDVARAALGTLHVKPGAAPVAEESKVLANMPPARSVMSAPRAHVSYLDDASVFYGLLASPTVLFGVAITARRTARRLSERAQQRKTSPLAELKQRQKALDVAIDGDDGRAIDGASIRVVEAATTAHAGVNVRGIGGESIASVLERAGVDKKTSTELRDLLEDCAAARFSPDGVELADARERASLAKQLVSRLEHRVPVSER